MCLGRQEPNVWHAVTSPHGESPRKAGKCLRGIIGLGRRCLAERSAGPTASRWEARGRFILASGRPDTGDGWKIAPGASRQLPLCLTWEAYPAEMPVVAGLFRVRLFNLQLSGAKRTSGETAACFGPTLMTTHNGPRPQRHAHRPHPVECDDISRCEADQVETGG